MPAGKCLALSISCCVSICDDLPVRLQLDACNTSTTPLEMHAEVPACACALAWAMATFQDARSPCLANAKSSSLLWRPAWALIPDVGKAAREDEAGGVPWRAEGQKNKSKREEERDSQHGTARLCIFSL
ncbi:hypothetical protein GOP47_0019189 [Adiantum capillus-veneris]|uniref:Uncharacterized protein n=1 Tax=Adiantum capillus-veneris TaxID=13818 RepID=A0A9D4ZAE8_ADICA|nr:hypothetical protein GOP47_0019189 [Adiantum capillus-veneris]